MSASSNVTRRGSKHLRLLASTSLLGLALAATPLSLSIDWQGSGVTLQTAEARSCFTAATLVLLADGSEKAICDIRVGDRVLSGRGHPNRVVAIERPRLAGRKLYAFNGGDAFVTAEHPFLTPAGWKALDPAATSAENPALSVGCLAVGDLLTVALPAGGPTANGNLALAVQVATSLLPLERIEAQAADPQTVVYNLLLDGDHSYIANGFVVHNKGGEGGESGGGGERGGEDRSGGGERGRDHAEDGGEHGELGEHGEHAGDDHGEHGEHGEHAEDDHGEHGEGGELAEDDDHHQGRGRGRGRGGDDFFTGDPAVSYDPLGAEQEATAIENGWR